MKPSISQTHVETGNLNEDHFDLKSLGKVADKKEDGKESAEDFGFDWGGSAQVATQSQDDELKLEWSEDEDDDEDDDDDYPETKVETNLTKKNTIDVEEEHEQHLFPEKIDITIQGFLK